MSGSFYEDEVLEQLKIYNQAYALGRPIISDEDYDRFVIDNNLGEIASGYGVNLLNKVKLPVPVFGMKKMQKESEYDRLVIGKSIIISEKLDGVSILLDTRKDIHHAYTKGDASEQTGQCVDWILSRFDIEHKGLFRGELIVSKKSFKKVKELTGIDNPLVFIASYVNSTKTRDLSLLEYIDLVIFEIISLEDVKDKYSMSPKDQFTWLSERGISVPNWKLYNTPPTFTQLKYIFAEFYNISNYIIDGIIISRNEKYIRNTEKDPEYSKAYKSIEQTVAEVKDVIWQTSERGFLKPVILIEPIFHEGKNYERVSGKNAKEIFNSKIGPGAEIFFGVNVVPVMYGVKTPAEKPKMPSKEYIWISDVDIMTRDIEVDQLAKKLTKFFQSLEVKNIKDTTSKKFIVEGVTSPKDFMNLDENAIKLIVGEKLGSNLFFDTRKALFEASEVKLLEASRAFPNLATKKLTEIYKSGINPRIDLPSTKPEGISGTNSWQVFNENIHLYHQFIRDMSSYIKPYKAPQQSSAKDEDVIKYIMTGKPNGGYKKDEFKKLLPTNYVEVTTVNQADIVIGDVTSSSSKIKTAIDKGVKIVPYEDFV